MNKKNEYYSNVDIIETNRDSVKKGTISARDKFDLIEKDEQSVNQGSVINFIEYYSNIVKAS